MRLREISDGNWYQFNKAGAAKETAVLALSERARTPLGQIIAFGDDYVDMAMLKLCGKGIAMGNAISAVKAIAGEVIGSNDEDGAAQFLLERYFVESF